MSETPASLGYRFPAEWEPHAATWISWPHNPATWPGHFEPIPGVYAHLVRTLAQFEPVNILAGGAEVMANAKHHLAGIENVTLWDIETNDAWTRDHGPMFLVGKEAGSKDGAGKDLPPALVDWEYNAWGGKYPPFDKDNAVPKQIAKLLSRRCFSPGIILEGGAVDGNGRGTILTTEQCLLNPNRNPHLSRRDMEKYLADYCGTKKVLWLGEGIVGDDTDGHIDELARFIGPRTVVAALEEDPSDENFKPLQDNFHRLSGMTDQDNRPLDLVPLPMPRAKFVDGQRVPACYCNFYIANGVVLVPQYNDPADAVALEIIQKLRPERQAIGMPAAELVWGLGTYHCITQQQPAL